MHVHYWWVVYSAPLLSSMFYPHQKHAFSLEIYCNKNSTLRCLHFGVVNTVSFHLICFITESKVNRFFFFQNVCYFSLEGRCTLVQLWAQVHLHGSGHLHGYGSLIIWIGYCAPFLKTDGKQKYNAFPNVGKLCCIFQCMEVPLGLMLPTHISWVFLYRWLWL